MADPVAEPTEAPSPPPEGPWRLPRHPRLAAVAVVAALVGSGWLLHWWGPLNPRVTATVHTFALASPPNGEATVELTNRSQTGVTVTGGRLAHVPDAPTTTPPASTDVRLVRVEDPEGDAFWAASEEGEDLPAEVAPGETVILVVRTEAPPCLPDGTDDLGLPQGTRSLGPATVAVDVRSSWGHRTTRSFVARSWSSSGCTAPLPPESAPPLDREAAVEAIGEAFTTAYDISLDPATRGSAVDDPRGLVEVVTAAMAGPLGAQVAEARPVVIEVSFDRRHHATVHYRLGVAAVDPRIGEAVLVGGTWKVTRSTVCADLALAGAPCPPLPR